MPRHSSEPDPLFLSVHHMQIAAVAYVHISKAHSVVGAPRKFTQWDDSVENLYPQQSKLSLK